MISWEIVEVFETEYVLPRGGSNNQSPGLFQLSGPDITYFMFLEHWLLRCNIFLDVNNVYSGQYYVSPLVRLRVCYYHGYTVLPKPIVNLIPGNINLRQDIAVSFNVRVLKMVVRTIVAILWALRLALRWIGTYAYLIPGQEWGSRSRSIPSSKSYRLRVSVTGSTFH